MVKDKIIKRKTASILMQKRKGVTGEKKD